VRGRAKKDQLHYIHRVASSMRRGVSQSIDPQFHASFLHTLLLYICRRFKVYIDTDIKRPARLVVVRLLRRSREKKRGGGHRKPYGCYSPQADNDIEFLPDQKTTTTQPAKKSGTRPSLIQTDRSRTFRPFLIPQETRK
jgi:hypothetical protein